MRAILIDTTNHLVKEIEIDKTQNQLKQYYNHIGCDIVEAAHFEIDGDTEHSLYVDEEGLMKDPSNFFKIKGGYQPYAGNGVIIGFDPKTGEDIDCTLPLEEVKNNVTFLRR